MDGNVVLRADEQIPAGRVINGDLILADGLGEGDVMLNDITFHGRIVVRGASGVTLGDGAKADAVVVPRSNTAVVALQGAVQEMYL